LVLHNKLRLLSISFLSCVSIAQLRGTAGTHTVVAVPSTCQIQGMKNLQSSNQYLEQTDKHPFNERSLFQVKPFWIVTKQEMTRWQWHQLDHMQIIFTSLRQITTPAPHPFLQAGCSSWRQSNSVKPLKATSIKEMIQYRDSYYRGLVESCMWFSNGIISSGLK